MTSSSDPDLAGQAERVVRLMSERGLTLALGESCTGGLIADLITDVAGSSRVFQGGIVAYANSAKERLLGVPAEILAEHGSVSLQTALAMALGAMERLGADIAAAVTGIAGPGGGTATKPVGLTWVAVAAKDGTHQCSRFVWSGGRQENKRHSAQAALTLIEELLAITDN